MVLKKENLNKHLLEFYFSNLNEDIQGMFSGVLDKMNDPSNNKPIFTEEEKSLILSKTFNLSDTDKEFIKTLIKEISSRDTGLNDDDREFISALKMSSLSEDDREFIKNTVLMVEENRKRAYHFEIKRNPSGYISEIIATPMGEE